MRQVERKPNPRSVCRPTPDDSVGSREKNCGESFTRNFPLRASCNSRPERVKRRAETPEFLAKTRRYSELMSRARYMQRAFLTPSSYKTAHGGVFVKNAGMVCWPVLVSAIMVVALVRLLIYRQ